MIKKLQILVAGLIIGLTSACGLVSDGSTEVRGGSFAVADSPLLVVNGDNGRIVVNAGPVGRVDVQATLRNPDDVDYEIAQEGDVITIEAESDGGGIFNFGNGPGADIGITTPPNTAVELRTSNGRIEVHGMQRSGTVRTSNGRIVLDDVSGDFTITTSNGGVTVTKAVGSFDIETNNGPIEFEGELTSNGDNKMTTSNGSVEVTLRGTPSVKLDGSTSNGSVTSDLQILTTSSGNQHHLVGTIGEGESRLLIRTSNGSGKIK